jgi:hypothetical protein
MSHAPSRPNVPVLHHVAFLVALVGTVALLGACAPDRPHLDATAAGLDSPLEVAPPGSHPPTTQPAPDTRGVDLVVVGGATAPPDPVEITGGDAALSGSLAFAGEPVEGATVRLERRVGGRTATMELTTNASGSWRAEDIQGGRYVIRAWLGDRLALPRAAGVFLAEDEDRQVHLAMVEIAPPPPADAPDDDDADDADTDADDEADADDADAGEVDDDADDDAADDASGTATTEEP